MIKKFDSLHHYKKVLIITSSLILWIGVIWREKLKFKSNLNCVSEKSHTYENHFLVPPNPIHNKISFTYLHDVWKWPDRWILKCCQSKNIELRHWIVTLLNVQATLPPSDHIYNSIGQVLDLDMSLLLILSNKHYNFFRKPPPLTSNRKVVDELIRLLLKVVDDCKEDLIIHGCGDKCVVCYVETAINQYLVSLSINQKLNFMAAMDEGDFISYTPYENTIIHLLRALLIHTQIRKDCECLCTTKAMLILRKLVDEYSGLDSYFEKKSKPCEAILILLLKIIANLSINVKSHDFLFQAGWMYILNDFLKSGNVNIELLATRIIHNIYNIRNKNYKKNSNPSHSNINASNESYVYHDNVYLLHPIHANSEIRDFDVVFIHGLYGGATFTWRQRDNLMHQTSQCWPKDWLGSDISGLRIIAVDYETHLSTRTYSHPHNDDIVKQAGQILLSLVEAGLGNRPIIWIVHSMGGILLKEILRRTSMDELNIKILDKTKGVVFMSVPHHGSHLANLDAFTSFLFRPTLQLQHLKHGSKTLEDLDNWFVKEMSIRCTQFLNFFEGLSTPITPLNLRTTIVKESNSCGYGGLVQIVDDADHIEVCKPKSRDDPTYQRILLFIQQIMNNK